MSWDEHSTSVAFVISPCGRSRETPCSGEGWETARGTEERGLHLSSGGSALLSKLQPPHQTHHVSQNCTALGLALPRTRSAPRPLLLDVAATPKPLVGHPQAWATPAAQIVPRAPCSALGTAGVLLWGELIWVCPPWRVGSLWRRAGGHTAQWRLVLLGGLLFFVCAYGLYFSTVITYYLWI